MNTEINNEIENTVVTVLPGRYAYLKTNKVPSDFNNHFLVSKDNDEVTIVTEEKNVSKINYEKDYKWFKLIEFKITKPFTVIGFLAIISTIIAEEGLNILLVSTFSKDYALINEKDISPAVDAFKKKGFSIN